MGDAVAIEAAFSVAYKHKGISEEEAPIDIKSAWKNFVRHCMSTPPAKQRDRNSHGRCERECYFWENPCKSIYVCENSGNYHICTAKECERLQRYSDGLICELSGKTYPLDLSIFADDSTGDRTSGYRIAKVPKTKKKKPVVSATATTTTTDDGDGEDKKESGDDLLRLLGSLPPSPDEWALGERKKRTANRKKNKKSQDDDGVMKVARTSESSSTSVSEGKRLIMLGIVRKESKVSHRRASRKQRREEDRKAKGEQSKNHNTKRLWKPEQQHPAAVSILSTLTSTKGYDSTIEEIATTCRALWKLVEASPYYKQPLKRVTYRYNIHCFAVGWSAASENGMRVLHKQDDGTTALVSVIPPNAWMRDHTPSINQSGKLFSIVPRVMTRCLKFLGYCLQSVPCEDMREYLHSKKHLSLCVCVCVCVPRRR